MRVFRRVASELSEKKVVLFVNKKKQKNFVNWSAPAAVVAFQREQKFFASFFQKRCFLIFLQLADFTCSSNNFKDAR